jgi:Putative transposase
MRSDLHAPVQYMPRVRKESRDLRHRDCFTPPVITLGSEQAPNNDDASRFQSNQSKLSLLPPERRCEEFIRRFLLHVLPDGFQRIRYYGFLGNRYREQKLAHCREVLGMPTPEPPALETAKDYRERYEELTGASLWQCPVCRQGRMLVTQILPAIDTHSHRHTPTV